MSARNLVNAGLGRFQTRATRIVEITGNRNITVPRHGGGTREVRVWDGTLYQSDGKTVDTKLSWNEDGSALNSQGVTSNRDLCIVIERRADPSEAAAEAAADETIDTAAGEVPFTTTGEVIQLLSLHAVGDETVLEALTRILRENDELKAAKPPKKKAAAKKAPAAKKKK